jgi:hypothetical protein
MNEALKQLDALLHNTGVGSPQFPPNSRYHLIAVATYTPPSGPPVAYLQRRFVPPAERLAAIQTHMIVQGDRLDNLAARYLGDPELFWRLCDANNAIRPDELIETIGRHLRITLPDGVPGS